jgi:putative endonuclease
MVKETTKVKKYFVYILECKDKTFYIGITNNLEKRIFAHNNLKSAAKYTKSRRPVVLKYFEKVKTKGIALKREFELKGLNREEKAKLIS